MSGDPVLPIDTVSGVSVCHLSHVLASFLPEWRIGLVQKDLKDFEAIQEDSTGLRKFFIAGSEAERLSISLPFYHRYSNDVDFQMHSDEDFINSVLLPCPVGHVDDPGTHIVLSTSETEPGYLRVEHIPRLSPLEHEVITCEPRQYYGVDVQSEYTGETRTFMSLMTNKQLHIDSMTQMLQDKYPNVQITLNGPAVTLEGVFDDWLDTEQSVDTSCAFECRTWPLVAREWITRSRPSGWLSTEKLREISDGGCFLVQVPHKKSAHREIEFRFSFTLGERKLAHSLTRGQRRCYIALKTIVCNKVRPNTAISSYCLKNIFFWTLDKIPLRVWENKWSGLGTCFLAMLDKLICCFAEHNLPHYFIPENNLIGHKPREMVCSALKQMVILRRHPIKEILAFDDTFQACLSINLPLSIVLHDFIHTAGRRMKWSEFELEYLASCRRKLQLTAFEFRERDFSEIVEDASRVRPNFLWTYLRHVQVLDSSIDSTNVQNFMCTIGVAWCSFVHILHGPGKYIAERKLVQGVFDMTHKLLEDDGIQYLVFHCRYAVFLYKTEQRHSAIQTVQRVLDWLPTHQISIDEYCHNRVDLNTYNAIAFPTPIQSLIQPSVSMITCVALACHIWIQCCLELHMADKAREILPTYIEHCMTFIPLLQGTQFMQFMVQTLSIDQKLLGDESAV